MPVDHKGISGATCTCVVRINTETGLGVKAIEVVSSSRASPLSVCLLCCYWRCICVEVAVPAQT